MRIFVYEFITGGGLAGAPLPPSLVHEADLMVRSLLDDLVAVPGVRILTSRDPRLPALSGYHALVPEPGEKATALYARGVAAADAAWPIAPETGGVLELLGRRTLDLGRVLLGCPPEAVRLTTSKRATVTALRDAGVPTVPTFAQAEAVPALPGPWVVKPDDGAGSENTTQVPDWRRARERLEADPGHLIAQPWLKGDALSLSLLCAQGRALLLSCNRQQVRLTDGRVSLGGISVNAIADRTGCLARLAGLIATAIPTLWGYVGVDLVQSPEGLVVLEINPRLTTSYCGLRQALGLNVAAMVLDLLQPDAATPRRRTIPEGGPTVEISLEALS